MKLYKFKKGVKMSQKTKVKASKREDEFFQIFDKGRGKQQKQRQGT